MVGEAKVWWLSGLGWTQREIADIVGMDLKSVNETCRESSALKKVVKEQAARGRTA